MSTLFQLCDALGQAEVARRLGVSRNAVNKAYRALRGVDAELIAQCAATQGLCAEGQVFDVEGTLLEWYRRLNRRLNSTKTCRAHAQAEEGGHAA